VSNPSRSASNGIGPRTPLTGISANRKASRDATDPSYLVPSRVGELSRKESTASKTGSESDSLLDLYGRTPSGSNLNVNKIDHDIPQNMYLDEEDPDGWIHRDKLARIESEELQAAGINLPTTRRAVSRNGRTGTSVERSIEETARPELSTQRSYGREEKRQRISSPVEEEESPPDQPNWDLRSPAEIAGDEAAQASSVYINPVLRKSGSRIPVLTSSPLPIPQEHIERDTPLPRSRAASGTMGENLEMITPRLRKRGNSAGSQVLLDDGGAVNGTPTPANTNAATGNPSFQGSPTKAKTAKSPTGTPVASTARKTTPAPRKALNQTKTATTATSNSSPAARPGTRSGETDRPRTAINRPEGDPPWLATMYKPDPRLPPDQQIIPTHAKRQQQAQWSEVGIIPTTYDREFSPLAVHTENGLKQPTPPAPISEKEDQANAWPLKPMLSVKSTSSGRPGTSGSATAGYSTMPKVVNTPPVGSITSPKIQSPTAGTFPPNRLQQQQPPEDPDQKEKGCGCCVVM
jgi:hypothetical protein